MATLNGWQRIWVVVAVPWAVLWVGGALFVLFTERELLIALGVLAFAVVPPLLLYAAGLAVAWILRGFLG